jgi:mono/diheme cytochrome c family protein
MFRITCCVLWCLSIIGGGQAAGQSSDQAPVVPEADHPEKAKAGLRLFRDRVRGILSQHCLECHGGASVKSDFSLATRQQLLASGFVGDSSSDSALMDLIRHESEPFMPWKKERISDAEIAVISKWIDLGAPYDKPLSEDSGDATAVEMQVTDSDRKFWSFGPLRDVTPPAVTDAEWCVNPIDQFILAKLEAAGIRPNSEASRETLIRRASFALLGLPPAPADVRNFVADNSPSAWAELTERLLDSPHYGERWARHWMDVARFAESHGYEQDYDRPHAYHYRDFLIQAFNSDLPYDKFVSWQLAGDELEPDNPLAMMATGFLGAGVFPTQLTEAEFESARYDELDDMVMTTGVAFLGLSVGCARCHDHKFDPLPARDYYSLAAVFGSTIRSQVELDLSPEENALKRAEYDERTAALEKELEDYRTQKLEPNLRKWLADRTSDQALYDWRLPETQAIESSEGTVFQQLKDGSWLASGTPPAGEILTLSGRTGAGKIAAVRLEALRDDSLPQGGPGRAPNGNFALGNLELSFAAAGDEVSEATVVKLVRPRATHQQNTQSLSVAASIDSDEVSGWAVDQGGIGASQAAVFDLEQAVDGDFRWSLKLTLRHPNGQHTLGRVRVSFAAQAELVAGTGDSGPPTAAAVAMQTIQAGRNASPKGLQAALHWFESRDSGLQLLRQQLTEHTASGPPVSLATVMVSSEGLPHLSHHADGRGFPHFYPETWLLRRGDVHQKQEIAAPGFLQVLTSPERSWADWEVTPPAGSRTSFQRASLAHWMMDTNGGAGGLAARVLVNRIWQHHFGTGLVGTPNDFGMSGDAPTHPQLLEWLAGQLVESGWSIRHIQRLILESRVWKQTGESDEQRLSVDRDNRLWWHRPRRRLEAEALRDSMLTVAGSLDRTPFGPGTLNQNMKRRSVYFFIKRSALIPVMMLFDWPEHLVSIGKRPVTTIAPQALMFMNSPEGRSMAEEFAKRIREIPQERRLQEGWWLAFSRAPREQELVAMRSFLEQQLDAYSTDHADKDAELLALVDLCQTLFAMNEFVYVE